jgi:hypothetical protein
VKSNQYVFDLIEKLGQTKQILNSEFYVVGSLVDIIYLDIDKKIKDIDLVYFGKQDLVKSITGSVESNGTTLGRKIRFKAQDTWIEIFTDNIDNPYTYISLYDINVQTPESRYSFITNFLLIEERAGWSNRYRTWFRSKKQYFTLIKSKYEYNNID